MGDWLHVHHCVICDDHATALRVYERIEMVAHEKRDVAPSGMRWGFWNARVVLLTTTRKWGTLPMFVGQIVDGLSGVTCLTSSDDADDQSSPEAFEQRVRERLGATRDFLWCDRTSVMDTLLRELTPLATGLTTLALVPANEECRLPAAAAEAIAPLPYTSIVYGFVTAAGECFVVGHFGAGDSTRYVSPLFTPLTAARQSGPSAWALHADLDGNALLPVHAPADDLWRIERHAAHGGWQVREQRLAIARLALNSTAHEERQAGCAMARRWELTELVDTITPLENDASPFVSAAASFATRVLAQSARPSPEGDTTTNAEELRREAGSLPEPAKRALAWIELARFGNAGDVANASTLRDDPDVGAAARWLLASCGDTTDRDSVTRLVHACIELAEVAPTFLRHAEHDDRAQRFLRTVGDMAKASRLTSYWMVRYGAPIDDDANSDPSWSGEATGSAARVLFWARRASEASSEPQSTRTLLRSFVAFNELLGACRANRVWWIPPVGLIHARLNAALAAPSIATTVGQDGDLVTLRAGIDRFRVLRQNANASNADIQQACQAALSRVPSPLTLWCYSQYGRAAPGLVSWLTNSLAWRLYGNGSYDEALLYARMALTYGDWDAHAARDTLVRILLALHRDDDAYATLHRGLARAPTAADLQELANSEGYCAWVARHAPRP